MNVRWFIAGIAVGLVIGIVAVAFWVRNERAPVVTGNSAPVVTGNGETSGGTINSGSNSRFNEGSNSAHGALTSPNPAGKK